MTAINPYLNFSGNCEEAFDFYRSVFGGEFVDKSRFSEMPSDEPIPEAEGEKIMHISLPLGSGAVLMGSDRPANMGPTTVGNNVQLSLTPESKEEADRLFAGLSAGGEVTMPMATMFWGSYFGMCNDKYGVQWMINYDES